MTFEELQRICVDVECGVGGVDWMIRALRYPLADGSDNLFIQLRYVEADIITGDPADQHGRKWYISSHSTKSEVVQTILKACLTSAEHMIREHFMYRGARVFGPHFDVDQLVTLSTGGSEAHDVRPPAKRTARVEASR